MKNNLISPQRKLHNGLTLKVLAVAIMGLSISACSMAPKYQRPDAPMPATWNESATEGAMSDPSIASQMDWQSFVTDESLRQLIGTALDNNRDLAQAVLNIEAARAQYRIQRAERLPNINVQGTGTRQRVPGDLSTSGVSDLQSSYQAGLALTAFEIDLFGRVKSL